MTNERHLERDLPSILGDLAMGPYPEYIDVVLSATARTRQRPGWTFRERWLPMEIATRPVATPAFPWGRFGVLALIALVAAAVAMAVGSQPRLPAPFGLAGNGRILFVSDNDLYVSDSLTSTPKLLIGGTEVDGRVRISRDGRSIAFLRSTKGGHDLVIGSIDGKDLRTVNDDVLRMVERFAWSPDGSTIVVGHEVKGLPLISLVATDGSGTTDLDTSGMVARWADWRPPDGRQLVFRGQVGDRVDLYVANADGSDVRPLNVPTEAAVNAAGALGGATWAPDGTRIAYHSLDLIDAGTAYERERWQTHVFDVESDSDIVLARASGAAVHDTEPSWSPDGRQILTQRFNFGVAAWMAVHAADGSSDVNLDHRSVEYPPSGWRGEFSPDGTKVIAYYDHTDEARWFDPTTGRSTVIDWAISETPTFQRVAP